MLRNDDSVSCYFSGSHQHPAVCRVTCTLQCLEEHLTSVCFPPGWYITPGSWDGKGLPYSEQSLGSFSPLWDSIPSCIFTILCSRAAQLNELMLDWKSTGAYEWLHKIKGPCDAVPRVQQWPPWHPTAAWIQKLLLSIVEWAHTGTITRVCEHKPLMGSQAAGVRTFPSFSTKQVNSLLFTTISFYSLPPSPHFIKAGEETSKPSLPEDYST